MRPDALRAELTPLGFSRIDDLGAADINRRYLAGRSDGLQARGVGRIAVARK